MLNVVTAYDAEEALQTLARFPNVDGVVLDTETPGMSCRELIDRLRAMRAEIPIVTVSPSGYEACGGEHITFRRTIRGPCCSNCRRFARRRRWRQRRGVGLWGETRLGLTQAAF